MIQVVSEAIAEVDYQPAAATLFVRFVDGDWYSYFDVPPNVYAAFLAAESHGRFFQPNIRNQYRYRQGR